MKYLIAGLGNIGSDYSNTRHNIGFKVLDALSEASNAVFSDKRYGDIAQVRHKGRTFVLLKPSTFMNLSGKAIAYWLKAEKIPIENLLVVVDDIALPIGTLRIRKKGSDGGHNGLFDIIQILGTQEFARLRFGIGGDFPKGNQVQYVLGEWTPEEKEILPERCKKASEIILSFGTIGLELTMTQYNKK
ncbi:MAG: aminoacyl-tRNA hydrolase [Bacteroidales bacterium]|nr:aminoacyl-tRNA hydrolase [Bacteroidales bacterium]MDY0196654.1 aminoacyl-tRNA hydrolase [Tenuifilaceae bacterium]